MPTLKEITDGVETLKQTLAAQEAQAGSGDPHNREGEGYKMGAVFDALPDYVKEAAHRVHYDGADPQTFVTPDATDKKSKRTDG